MDTGLPVPVVRRMEVVKLLGEVAAAICVLVRERQVFRIPPVGAAYRWFPIWVMVSALIS
jgi:hypothetical protein